MLKRICDRCGTEALEHSTGFVLHCNYTKPSIVVDLCEKCDKELNEWGYNPETRVIDSTEYESLYSDSMLLHKIRDIAYYDDMDHYDKMERILNII